MSSAGPAVTAPGSAVRRGLLLALAGVVMFSFTLPFTKIALRGYDPVVIAMGRAAIAGAVSVVALRMARVRWPGRYGAAAAARHRARCRRGLPRPDDDRAAVDHLGARGRRHRGAPDRDRGARRGAHGGAPVPLVLVRRGVRDRGARRLRPSPAGERPAATSSPTSCSSGRSWPRRTATSRAPSSPGGCPGWQVISWVLVVMLPVTVVATVASTCAVHVGPAHRPGSRPRRCSTSPSSRCTSGSSPGTPASTGPGCARASQVQLLQPLLTLVWSVLLARRDRRAADRRGGGRRAGLRRLDPAGASCPRSIEDLAPEAP